MSDRPAPEVVFTRYAESKFDVLERHGFRVTRVQVIDALLKPDTVVLQLRLVGNLVSLGWWRLCHLSAAPLWWLWLVTMVAYLLWLLGGGILPSTEATAAPETGSPVWNAPSIRPALLKVG